MLAIDGGNSKTDVALVAADGRVLGTARGPGALVPDPEGLEVLVREAARTAGLDGSGPVADHTSACLANADLPEEEAALARELSARGWSGSTRVYNDTFALLRSGSARPWGVAVVCGAGINCVGIGPDGRVSRFLALGMFTGDWGGGSWLADEMMWWAMRAEDGRGPQTVLRELVPARFGLDSVHEVAVAVHQRRIGADALVAMSPVLFQAADAGDQVAGALVDRQAEEVFLMARVALERLGLLESDAEVVLGGGVLAARHPRLIGGIRDRLGQVAPRAVLCQPDIPPVAGAALLGLDRLGRGAAAAATRLRAHYSVG